MKSILLAVCSIFILQTFTNAQVQSPKVSGDIVEQERNGQDFSAIVVEHGVDVHITQGNAYKIVVKADAKFADYIQTNVKGQSLYISSTARSMRSANKLEVHVIMPTITAIEAQGGSDVFSTGKLSTDVLEINARGGSDIKLELDAKSVECNISGGSDVLLTGSTEKLVLRASGGSDFSGKNFKAKKANVLATGGSDASVHATDEVELEAQGGSDISYKGGAKILHKKATGSSDINGH